MLDVSEFAYRSFWLEIIFKCVRSFFQAFIHGIFTNRSTACLLMLMLLDIMLVGYVVGFYRSFKYKTIFFLVILYFLAFFCVDLTLLTYVLDN